MWFEEDTEQSIFGMKQRKKKGNAMMLSALTSDIATRVP